MRIFSLNSLKSYPLKVTLSVFFFFFDFADWEFFRMCDLFFDRKLSTFYFKKFSGEVCGF